MTKDDDELLDLPEVFIRERMKARKITGKTLAEMMGTSEPQVSRLLTGERRMSLGWLYAFAKALDVPIAELFSDPGQQEPKVTRAEDIHSFLDRIEGLTPQNVESFVTMIVNTITANAASQARSANDGRPAPDIRHREELPLR